MMLVAGMWDSRKKNDDHKRYDDAIIMETTCF